MKEQIKSIQHFDRHIVDFGSFQVSTGAAEARFLKYLFLQAGVYKSAYLNSCVDHDGVQLIPIPARKAKDVGIITLGDNSHRELVFLAFSDYLRHLYQLVLTGMEEKPQCIEDEFLMPRTITPGTMNKWVLSLVLKETPIDNLLLVAGLQSCPEWKSAVGSLVSAVYKLGENRRFQLYGFGVRGYTFKANKGCEQQRVKGQPFYATTVKSVVCNKDHQAVVVISKNDIAGGPCRITDSNNALNISMPLPFDFHHVVPCGTDFGDRSTVFARVPLEVPADRVMWLLLRGRPPFPEGSFHVDVFPQKRVLQT